MIEHRIDRLDWLRYSIAWTAHSRVNLWNSTASVSWLTHLKWLWVEIVLGAGGTYNEEVHLGRHRRQSSLKCKHTKVNYSDVGSPLFHAKGGARDKKSTPEQNQSISNRHFHFSQRCVPPEVISELLWKMEQLCIMQSRDIHKMVKNGVNWWEWQNRIQYHYIRMCPLWLKCVTWEDGVIMWPHNCADL